MRMKAWASVPLACIAFAAFAAPAAAGVPPTKQVIGPLHQVLTDPTACGSYGVTWNTNLTVTLWTFFDGQGRRVKRVAHVEEDNTVVNTVTGLTLRDGPVNFVETVTYDAATNTPKLVFIVGTSADVRRGNERLVDRGPILIDGQTGRILWSAGPHPLRELLDGSFDTRLALPGFCHILRP
jgi:hypothetical protein